MLKYLIFLPLAFVSLYSLDTKYELGKTLYEQACLTCHGSTVISNEKLKFIVNPRSLNKTILNEEQSYQIIKKGSYYWGSAADMMPSFEPLLSEMQLKAIAYYTYKEFNPNLQVRIDKLYAESSLVQEDKKSQMLKTGEKIFKKNCSLCHGIKGDAESKYVQQSKAFKYFIHPYNLTRTLLNEKQIFLYAKFGGKFWGSYKRSMPSWEKKYNNFELKSVAKYINEKIKKID